MTRAWKTTCSCVAFFLMMVAPPTLGAPLLLDDFQEHQSTTDRTADGSAVSTMVNYTVGGHRITRTLIVDQTANGRLVPDGGSGGVIDAGGFRLWNDPGANAIFELHYWLDDLVDPDSVLALDIQLANIGGGQPFTIQAYLNGGLLGGESFTGATLYSLRLAGFGDQGNLLRLVFSGNTAFETTVGSILLERTGDISRTISEPGMIGLLGFGIAAVAAARCRRRAGTR